MSDLYYRTGWFVLAISVAGIAYIAGTAHVIGWHWYGLAAALSWYVWLMVGKPLTQERRLRRMEKVTRFEVS